MLFLVFFTCDKSCNLRLLQINKIKLDWKGANIVVTSLTLIVIRSCQELQDYIAKLKPAMAVSNENQ